MYNWFEISLSILNHFLAGLRAVNCLLMATLFLKLFNSGTRMLLSVMGISVALIIFYQLWSFPSDSDISSLLPAEETPSTLSFRNIADFPNPWMNGSSPLKVAPNSTFLLVEGDSTSVGKMVEADDSGRASDRESSGNGVGFGKDLSSMRRFRKMDNRVEKLYILDNGTAHGNRHKTVSRLDISMNFSSIVGQVNVNERGPFDAKSSVNSSTSGSLVKENDRVVGLEEPSWKNESLMIEKYVRKMRGATITFSEMKSMLHKNPISSTSLRPRWSLARDRELLSARKDIMNAPILMNIKDLYAPLFRNVSMFKRSYDLMERLLKIYIYKEGEKPIFHQPRLRGIYAAEGWFMKLIERSKRFVVRDPKKAHLYYLPFSSEILRITLYEEKSPRIKNLEHYLTGYVDLIKKKYRFWNRTGGADHFLVACHDWAPRITRQYMSSCIRALCNANIARGFSIGKDVSVPVTFIRSGNAPLKDIGGKPPSERNILAFFAGSMHGYLRPLLLKYWENKVPDMKIFGPMKRDLEGIGVYREFMKSSKYCICARGYGVHTPRVVESIFYECVPVIISDNYVPPFFEVLDWEAFSLFVQEKDVPNLRNILLSIPEDRYLEMQLRVKMVQRHFIWHKIPEKYDLFHMILHSIWYSRVSQVGPK